MGNMNILNCATAFLIGTSGVSELSINQYEGIYIDSAYTAPTFLPENQKIDVLVICDSCLVSKKEEDFYKKDYSRLDNLCKDCRKKLQQKKYALKKMTEVRPVTGYTPPARTIEPVYQVPPTTKKIAPASKLLKKSKSTKINYNDLNILYGTELSPIELEYSIQRLNEFVVLLTEGFSEISRSKIYIKKI